jgi:hypothetical protein
MKDKISEQEKVMKDLFDAMCAIEPEKSKGESIDDPATQELLKFFSGFILRREKSLLDEIAQVIVNNPSDKSAVELAELINKRRG